VRPDNVPGHIARSGQKADDASGQREERMAQMKEHRILGGENPFGVLPEHDLLHEVRSDVPDWSETMYFHVWNPEAGVGVFIHIGRWPGDLDLWWGQVIALLPDGELLVDRSWGRAQDDRGPATGNLRVECVEPLKRWRVRFDGAGEPTDLARMAEGPVGSGRARAFRFDVALEAAAPVWDMHGALGIDNLSWAAFHHTQGLRTAGTLVSEGREWTLDGVAHRDHSSGPRHIFDFGGLHFFVFVFPTSGRVVNGLVNWKRDATVDHRIYTDQVGGRCETGTGVSITGLHDIETHSPRQLTVTLIREGGRAEELAAEWLHGYTLTLLEPNENINGAHHDAEDDPLIVTQGTVRVTAPDGEIGYGVIERDYRRSMLPSPDAK
jgi:hypothetical protein